MTAIVLDASAGVEMLARSALGKRLARQVPRGAVLWVPDGLFDVEVLAVLRRWDLNGIQTSEQSSACVQRLRSWRLRRSAVTRLSDAAWGLRANITFPDACYVALAQALEAPLLTTDVKLASGPTLPVRIIQAAPED